MLTPVSVGNKSLADYTHLAGRPLIEEIRELAKDLEGLRVLHLSATAFGGGVSEILYTLILEEAGAVVTDAYGRSLRACPLLGSDHEHQMSVVASGNSGLHEAILRALDAGFLRVSG